MEKVLWKDVILLWHSGYYDGPLSGMCQFRGEKLWFECEGEDRLPGADENSERIRTFRFYRLTEEQMASEEKWYELFRENVGTHCDYSNGKRTVGLVRPKESWAKYYGVAEEKPELNLAAAELLYVAEER